MRKDDMREFEDSLDAIENRNRRESWWVFAIGLFVGFAIFMVVARLVK